MKLLTREQLAGWLEALARERPLVAPHEAAGVLLYRPVTSSGEIAWGSTRPVMSIKEVFFPPTERLLTIETNGGQVTLTEIFSDEKPVVFGVRPCDARGMQMLDALFIDTHP
jgi:hypothetical protein